MNIEIMMLIVVFLLGIVSYTTQIENEASFLSRIVIAVFVVVIAHLIAPTDILGIFNPFSVEIKTANSLLSFSISFWVAYIMSALIHYLWRLVTKT